MTHIAQVLHVTHSAIYPVNCQTSKRETLAFAHCFHSKRFNFLCLQHRRIFSVFLFSFIFPFALFDGVLSFAHLPLIFVHIAYTRYTTNRNEHYMFFFFAPFNCNANMFLLRLDRLLFVLEWMNMPHTINDDNRRGENEIKMRAQRAKHKMKSKHTTTSHVKIY